jgi:hypothetical protein
MNGNRTTFSDNFNGSVTSVDYWYDNADRLTGTTDRDAPAGVTCPRFPGRLGLRLSCLVNRPGTRC